MYMYLYLCVCELVVCMCWDIERCLAHYVTREFPLCTGSYAGEKKGSNEEH